ncbi:MULTISPECIES: hypothetical protein [Massilia]|uniref:hypothetical protein n=1 Tax=Massilia TaxID=149698 RepID=UPI000F2DE2BF|nr:MULTISPECIES: hypothetical protein [Massilia]MDY0961911.1 hypothetical protein [Massilia sp. CFBP9026]
MVQQHTRRLSAAFATCALAFLSSHASGAEAPGEPATPTPVLKLSGFGTLGAVYADARSADFTASVLRADGAGHTRAWSPDVDSRLGAQLDLDLGAWSGVLQVVSEQRLDGSYAPQLEWANIKYQLTPDLAVRAGRIALPVFLGAESRKIGYTIPWVRTPVEVYGSLPISSSDGLDATWRWSTGSVLHATQVFAGRTDQDLRNGLRIKAEDIVGLSHSIERGAVSARLSAASGRLNTAIGEELFTVLRRFGPAGDALANRYEIKDKRVSMVSIGMSVDPGAWFVTAECGRTRTDSLLGGGTSMYVGAGLRRGALTPYAGYAQVRADVPTRDPGLPTDGLPPPLAAAAGQINAGINDFLATIPVQSTWSAGLRWDAATNIALKLQLDRVRPREGSRGTLINNQPDLRPDRAVHVGSVALDFVF